MQEFYLLPVCNIDTSTGNNKYRMYITLIDWILTLYMYVRLIKFRDVVSKVFMCLF